MAVQWNQLDDNEQQVQLGMPEEEESSDSSDDDDIIDNDNNAAMQSTAYNKDARKRASKHRVR